MTKTIWLGVPSNVKPPSSGFGDGTRDASEDPDGGGGSDSVGGGGSGSGVMGRE